MTYMAYFHIDVLKDNVRLTSDELPTQLLSETLDLSSSKELFEDFYAYLQDYHRTGLEEDLQKLKFKIHRIYFFAARISHRT